MKRSPFIHAFYESRHSKLYEVILGVCWSFGLLLGFAYGTNANPLHFQLMRVAAFEHTSIIGLVIVLYIPLLLSALAVNYMCPQMLLLICFVKAFLFAACSGVIAAEFGSSGWLIRFLLQFSDCCAVPLLYLFSIRNISVQKSGIQFDFLLSSIVLLIVGCVDYFVISPFLVRLINI